MLAKIGVLLIVIVLVLTLFKKFTKQKEITNKSNDDKPVEMMQDPVCGTFVEEVTEYKVKYYDNIYYFCSDKCKQEFIKSKQS